MLPCILAIQNESDRSLVEQLFTAYGSTMLCVAQRLLKDRGRAEDAVSAAFVKIIDQLQNLSFENCKQTRALVVIIVRNICLNMLNDGKRQKTVSLDTMDEIPAPGEDVPSDFAITKENYRLLLTCLKSLPQSYQDILALRLAYEYSNEKISGLLGISPNNVSVRYHRARKALMEELRKRGYMDESFKIK